MSPYSPPSRLSLPRFLLMLPNCPVCHLHARGPPSSFHPNNPPSPPLSPLPSLPWPCPAYISPFIPKSKIADTANVGLHFAVNGTTRQKGVSSDMIFPVPDLIAFVSSIMKLEEGDLILTGTPKGVSRMVAGDKFEAKMTYPGVDGDVLDQYEFDVVDRKGSAYEFKG